MRNYAYPTSHFPGMFLKCVIILDNCVSGRSEASIKLDTNNI